eukprot:COSAG06_NODE_2832_length_6205_cov_6.623485_4_plen_69_part_00
MFEYLDQDLKKHMDSVPGGMAPKLVKVCPAVLPVHPLCGPCEPLGPPDAARAEPVLLAPRTCRATCSR